MKNNLGIPSISIIIGVGILGFIGVTVLLSSLAFLFHGSITAIWMMMAFLISSSFIFFMLKNKKGAIWTGLLLLTATTVVSFIGSSVTVDNSFDGNWYHKEAVGLLKEGWNPIYEKSNARTYMYVDAYPKAAWIFAANAYSLTGNIESGKAIGFLVVFAVFFIAYGYLRSLLSRNKSMVVAAIVAASPVALSQIFTFYVDGIMAGLLVILTLLLSMTLRKSSKLPGWCIYASVALSIALLINLKYTGIVYAGITVGVYWLYILFKKDWKKLLKLSAAGLAGLVVGLLVIGAPTYIKNYIVHQQPLYPLMGPDAIDIITSNQPSSYIHKSGIHKFIESNFGETMNITEATDDVVPDSPLKIPFSIKISELEQLASGTPDIRQAGYGVWFGGALLLTVAAIFLLIVRYRSINIHGLLLLGLPVIPVLIIALLFSESWWARYLPHLIIIPACAVVGLFLLDKHRSGSTVIQYILLFVLIFNSLIIATLNINYQVEYGKATSHKINALIEGCDDKSPIRLYAEGMTSIGSRFNIKDRCANTVFVDSHQLPDGVDTWNGIYRK